jgi:antitoxin component YwqK of YwqJK toxin-antitoxin module
MPRYVNRWDMYGAALDEGRAIGRYNRGVERQDRIRTEDIEREEKRHTEAVDWRTKETEKADKRYEQGVEDTKEERTYQRGRQAKADVIAEDQRTKAEEERKIRLENLKREQEAKKIALDQHYDRMEWLASGGGDVKTTEALLSKGMRDGKQAKITTNEDGSYSIQIFSKDGKPLGTPKPFAADADEFQAIVMRTLGDESYSKAYYENRRKKAEKDEEAIDPDKIVVKDGISGIVTRKGFKPIAGGITSAKKKEPGFYDKEDYKQVQKELAGIKESLNTGINKSTGEAITAVDRKKLEMKAKGLQADLDNRKGSGDQPAGKAFDPEGADYDETVATRAGMQKDEAGHMGSVAQLSPEAAKQLGLPEESYLVLKGRKHPTWEQAEQAEASRGFKIIKGPGGRYFSVPKEFAASAMPGEKKPPLPLDVPAGPPTAAGITGAGTPGGQPAAVPTAESGSGYNPQDPNTWNVIQQGSDLYIQTPAGPEKMTPEQIDLWKQTEAGAAYFQPIINKDLNLNPERRRQGIAKSFARTPPMVR